ncbi:unnamed protein product [Leptidea sinapis]|uniref:Uncharacterized protein n=1 Tax=Leptidea sinapis TaxID=189913 RepID=A0A5E4Q6E7_9NEOP|nr:unnamed protein product [Leptidea sinapis]
MQVRFVWDIPDRSQKIDLIIKDTKDGLSAPKADWRGRHQNRPHKMDGDVTQRIKAHISNTKDGLSAPKADWRGRHQNRPHKMDDDVTQRIKAHISSFSAEQSHYSRNKNMYKLYLSPLLNI